MSRRFRIVVEYDGTDFHGWQRQIANDGSDLRTVQATLEDAIREMTGETLFVRAAGRTDAGVHADGQVASFDLAANIPPHGLLRGLNSILPADVAIVPVAIHGSGPLMPPGSPLIRAGTVTVEVDEPIPTEGLSSGDRNALIEKVRGRIAAMLGEPHTRASRESG